MREPDECGGLDGQCGLARGHAEPCRTCFMTPAATFRETPPASPLADLKGAVTRLETAVAPGRTSDEARRALCSPAELVTLIRAGQEAVREQTASPAAMLAEALEHIRTARALIAATARPHDDLAERADNDLEDALQRVDGLKREAEAREAADGR